VTARPSAAPPALTLWISPHFPDPDRSGVDARHLDMMQALGGKEADLTVVSTHGTHDGRSSRRFEALGIDHLAPPPDERWDLGAGHDRWLEDAIEARQWNTIIVGHPHMAGGILSIIERRAKAARTIVDLATVRFPAAHDPTADPAADDPRIETELAALTGADAVVTATEGDRRVIELVDPSLPSFVWSALGEDVEPGSGGALDGPPLYVGDLLHHPNAQGLEWWLDVVAARVEARMGRPIPLRAVGTGSEIYRAIWTHPRKIHLAGWQPDLGVELAGARLLAIPLTYATGTGGRMATALASGLPVVASAPAAALLPGLLAGLVRVGSTPAEFAEVISTLLNDDDGWHAERARILQTDIPALRRAQTTRFSDWLASIKPGTREPAARRPNRRSGSRRGLRRLSRAS